MAHDINRAGAHAAPQPADQVGKRLAGVPDACCQAFPRQGEGFAQKAEADVEQDKKANDHRVTTYTALLDTIHQLDVAAILERRCIHDKTPDQEIDHADQDGDAEDIGQEAIDVTDRALAQERDGEISLQDIAEVDQEIESKTPGDHGVKDA